MLHSLFFTSMIRHFRKLGSPKTEVLLWVNAHWQQTNKLIILILLHLAKVSNKVLADFDSCKGVQECYLTCKYLASLCSNNISLHLNCTRPKRIPTQNHIICQGDFCVALEFREHQLPDARGHSSITTCWHDWM